MRRPQKTCAICESGVRVVDYKDERTLSRFLTERGKILPSRLSGYLRPPPAAAEHRHQAGPAAGPAALHQGLRGLRPARGGGQVLLFVGYLLVAPPMFVFGPLVGLLLLSRPATLREWVWVAAATAWSVLWLSEAGGLSGQFVRAAAVLVSGSYLALTLWRPSNQLSRCLAATAGAGVALGGWMIGLGVRWTELRQSIQLDLAEIDRVARTQWSGMSGAGDALADLAGMADTLTMLYPGLLALAAIGGLRLAWSWYHRIAERPIGPAPAPFTAFSFNDQMVWGW